MASAIAMASYFLFLVRVLKFEPKFLSSFNFLDGPNATGSYYFYGAGEFRPLGSCRMTDGVAQGDGFGPSSSEDGAATSVRGMRPLPEHARRMHDASAPHHVNLLTQHGTVHGEVTHGLPHRR